MCIYVGLCSCIKGHHADVRDDLHIRMYFHSYMHSGICKINCKGIHTCIYGCSQYRLIKRRGVDSRAPLTSKKKSHIADEAGALGAARC